MGHVVVLGSLNLDLVARVARLPDPGETVTAVDFIRRPGGKGANQATAAGLAAHGVDVSGVRKVPGTATGHALIIVDSGGGNTIVVVPGGHDSTGDPEVHALALAPGDVLLLQNEIPASTVRAAARAAREAGCIVLLNPLPWRGLDRELFDDCDALIVNSGEAERLCWAGYDADRRTALRAGVAAGGQAVTHEGVQPWSL